MRMPHAIRPYRNLILAVASVIEDDKYLDMTKGEFLAKVMTASNCTSSPCAVNGIYHALMKDAGLEEK